MNTTKTLFSCIILAGGEGRRVDGRDKGLIDFKGKPLVQHVIDAVKPQADEIIISANRNIKMYGEYGYKIVTDTCEDFQGPLAGIAAALPFCKNDWTLIVPCDMPFLPTNLIETLSIGISDNISNSTNYNLCIAETKGRLQLVFLMNKNLLPSLEESLQNNKLRLMQWVMSQKPKTCQYSETHYFENYNQTQDLL